MQELWSINKNSDGYYNFLVKQASPPIGPILWGIISIPVFGAGLFFLAYIFISRRRKYEFAVNGEGFKVDGRTIPLNRVNSWGASNPHDNIIHDISSVGGAVQSSYASKAYRLTLQVGGGNIHIAKGLKIEQAEGLMADVKRAIQGVL